MARTPVTSANNDDDNEEVYTVELVDAPQHTPGHMCWDSTCPCHEDQEIIGQVNQHVQDGLLTPDNATDIVKGRNVWNISCVGGWG
jgi:hypothetical protein